MFTVVPQGRTFYHRVSRGETLVSLARRYGVTAAELREWNGMVSSSLRAGQQLRVTSDVVRSASPRGHARAATATAGAKSLKGVKAPAVNGRAAAARGNGAKPGNDQRSTAREAAAPLRPASAPTRIGPAAPGGASIPAGR